MASLATTSELIEDSTIDSLENTQDYAPTPFAIQFINVGDDLPSALLQVLSFQKMQNNRDDTDRHKLVLSDGTYMQLAILPSKYAILIDSDILKIGTIVQLSSYTCRYIWNTRYHSNTRKDGSQTQKRVVKINDLSGSTIEINLRGPMAEQRGLELKNMLTSDSVVIIALLNACVGYFNGKLINITAATTLHINPPFLEAEPLTLRGKDPLLVATFVPETIHTNGKYSRMTISSIHERMSIKPETIQTTLLVVLRFVNVTNKSFYYAACPLIVNGRPCKKKCTQQADDSWFCPRCEMIMQDCNYSYLLQVKLQDSTGTLWATAFDDVGISLLQKTAKELCALENDATTTKTPCSVINRLLSHHYLFTLLVSTDTYNS
ncbi:replication protein A 70 kDa DNA-binding subunit A-like [Cryptomeria japonica]|uniref:replication protein A 70 kDa DNA-binding subunit A-like n=1 Tax=Cryptomeria japonica TaxID=3369 RepID=UPI0027DA1B69|nr:replication protein A 70 kDa DNA-binding subunit A-like [Cryptomeria japonica]